MIDDKPPKLNPKGNIRGVNEALDALKESQPGTHGLVIYPDMPTIRAIYSLYSRILLEDSNEIVLILPYYETTDMVRLVLSGKNVYDDNSNNGSFVGYSGVYVSKYEREGSLIIKDSLIGHFGSHKEQKNDYQPSNNNNNKNMDLMAFLNVLIKHAERRRKDGVTVLSDMGSFYHNNGYDHHTQKLMSYEKTEPTRYVNRKLKWFCLYHQRDFERRFSQGQQATLLDYHRRNIMLVNAD
jgi:hypothetical protein